MIRSSSLLFVALLLAPGARADSVVSQIDRVLGGVPAAWADSGLRVRVNGGGVDAFREQEDMAYHFSAAQEAHLTVLHRDSEGAITVLIPSRHVGKTAIAAGGTVSIEDLVAGPPFGVERVYAFATRSAIDARVLEFGSPEDRFAAASGADAVKLAEIVSEALRSLGPDAVAARQFAYEIVSGDEIEFTVASVIGMITPTRSVPRPKLDFHRVTFAFDSSELTQRARRNLDVLGQALQSPGLAERSFALGGHTDDLGEADYNERLSERRADAAKKYLVERWKVSPERIGVRGHGESRPAVPEQTEEARALNRRVEIEILR